MWNWLDACLIHSVHAKRGGLVHPQGQENGGLGLVHNTSR
jgi:hypothetical protein